MKSIKTVLILAAVFFLGACTLKTVQETLDPAYQLFSQSEKMLQAKSYEEALSGFGQYYERFPDGPLADAALMKMASIHMILGNNEQARSLCQRLILEYPESHFVSDARFEILLTYYNMGEYKAVIEQATDFLRRTPSRVHILRTYMLLGDAYMAIGFPKDTVNYYIMAFKEAKDKEKGVVVEKLKAVVRGLGSEDILYFIEQSEDDTLNAHLMFQLGITYAEEEKYGEALKVLTAFTEKFPSHENIQEANRLIGEINQKSVYSRYTIGCLLPLSGSYKIYGNGALNGIKLAFSQFNSQNPKHSFKVIIKDTASDPGRAAMAVKELFDDNVAAIIGPVVTAESAALAAQNHGIPIITLTQKDNIPEIGEYVFRNFITPGMQMKTLVDYAVRELGLSRFAVLYPDEKYGVTFMNLFWDEVIAHGGTVVGVESYRPELTDFADPIKKLVGLYYDVPENMKKIGQVLSEKTSEARYPTEAWASGIRETEKNEEPEAILDFDAIFIPDASRKSGLIVPQLAFHDVKDIYLLGTNLWHSDKLIEMAREYVQGAIMPEGFFAESTSNNVSQFVDAYQETFDREPGFMEAAAYDTARILFQVMGQPHVRFRSVLKNELKQLKNFEGVTGLTSFDEDGDAQKNLYILQISGRHFVELEHR